MGRPALLSVPDIKVEWELYQTNHEGEMVEKIHEDGTDGLVLNPAAWTHYSIAIRDAVAMADYPVVEIHISNLHDRGKDVEWRDKSVIAPECAGQIVGFGAASYELGMRAVHRKINDCESS